MATQTTVVSESAGQMSNVEMPRLPLGELGFKYIPAVPVDPGGVGDTLFKLAVRLKQREQPLQGLSKTFTIGGSTARAYNFLFGTEAADVVGHVSPGALGGHRRGGFLHDRGVDVARPGDVLHGVRD